ncbi:MAG: hypothetical protein HYV34_01515 [Candidatus Kerfeldbacteria bacterium]|nr:hypothetical protein [Candidatus Kerfeldbacteria bacterium]
MKLGKLFAFEGSSSSILTNLAIVMSIIVLLNLLVHVAIPTFFKQPTQAKSCAAVVKPWNDIATQETCTASGGRWTAGETVAQNVKGAGYCDSSSLEIVYDENDRSTYAIPGGHACLTEYTGALRIYERNGFFIVLAIFILSLIVGLNLHAFPAASYGLIYGSVVLLVSGTIRFWQGIGDYWRLGLLAAALGVLIWLGVRIGKQHEKPKR